MKKVLLNLLLFKLLAFLIVCLSAYIQLSFFKEALNSKVWQQGSYLWILGVLIDLYIFITAVLIALEGKTTSITISIGWAFSFLSTVSYSKLTLLRFVRVDTDNTLLLSILKGFEFLILSTFHLLCMFITAQIGNVNKREEREDIE